MNRFFLTCEHAGNFVPKNLNLNIPSSVLNSHRGIDIGAYQILKKLGRDLNTEIHYNKLCRLVIEYNRSLHHPRLFSDYTKGLKENQKKKLIADYLLYREHIVRAFGSFDYHLSIHSFTPVMNGEKRNCDIGLLYDPARKGEREFSQKLKSLLKDNGINCRLNYPYLGKADGLTTYLRKKLGPKYRGIEVEFNQALVKDRNLYNFFLESIKIL